MAESISVAPKFQKPLIGEARPSNWKLSMVKPRAENDRRLLSLRTWEMPGALSRICAVLLRPSSSICWRVTTLTDCGVSRIDIGKPMAVDIAPVV